ncbi:hypothetical protein HG530_001274 [Fusarium avenaceum]|nr:hypothetical protein HG530_001274 [Fusarium avenaceum]
MSLLRPRNKIVRLPDLKVQAALSNGIAPRGSTANRQIRSNQEESVALGRPDDERVPQTLGTELRSQHRLAAVKLLPIQGVVAVASSKEDVLALFRVARETIFSEHIRVAASPGHGVAIGSGGEMDVAADVFDVSDGDGGEGFMGFGLALNS